MSMSTLYFRFSGHCFSPLMAMKIARLRVKLRITRLHKSRQQHHIAQPSFRSSDTENTSPTCQSTHGQRQDPNASAIPMTHYWEHGPPQPLSQANPPGTEGGRPFVPILSHRFLSQTSPSQELYHHAIGSTQDSALPADPANLLRAQALIPQRKYDPSVHGMDDLGAQEREILKDILPAPPDRGPSITSEGGYIHNTGWIKHVTPCIAAAIALAITALLVLVVFIAITVPSSRTFKLVYTPFIAIAASTITIWISSQIQHLFLIQLDIALSERGRPIDRLNSRWRAVLRVSTIGEMLKKHHPVTLVFIGAGLISASINAGLALSIATKSIAYYSSIPDGLVYDCAKYITRVDNQDAGTPLQAQYLWQTPAGTYFRVWPNVGTCPPRYAVALMNNINTQNPDAFAYGDLGVAVDRSAMGAPYTFYSPNPTISPNLTLALAQHGEDLLEITQCVPVMTSNPVSCRTGGSVNMTMIPTPSINVSSGYCSQFNPINAAQPGPAMSMGICMHDEIGQATIILGGNGGYAVELAYSIGDRTIRNDTHDSISYVVTCEVDTRSVIQYRAVKLSMQGRNGINGSFARALTSVGPCPSPPSPSVISEVYIGVAAMASWQVLAQNWGYDGYFETISETALDPAGLGTAGVPRNPPFAFPGSKSALEDVLGLNAALVLSRLNSNTTTVGGIATVRFSRVGSASRFTLFYALPPLISFVALAWLIVTTPALDHRLRSIQLEDLKSYL